MRFIHTLLIGVLLLGCGTAVLAQVDGAVVVDKLIITGNKRTRVSAIKRELPFQVGDTIQVAELAAKLTEAERQVMNTGLFASAEITFEQWTGDTQRVQLRMTVIESWYLFPVPTFSLADRSFNVWWQEQGRSLERINIGMSVKHENFSGWGDVASIGFKYGYTRSFRMSYRRPYLNKKQTLGLNANVDFSKNREVNYATDDNKQLFYNDESRFLRKQYKAEVGLNWRPALYAQHLFAAEFHHAWVDSIIIQEYNPLYFEGGRNAVDFFRLRYRFDYDFRDNRAYPWEGYQYGAEIVKDGIGIFKDRNALTLGVSGIRYHALHPRWSASVGLRAKYSLIRTPQPAIYNRAHGFGSNRMSGYELYVIDGLDAVMLRTGLRFRIWEGEINFGKWVFMESFRRLPMHLNVGLSSDLGFVNALPDPLFTSPLANRTLWGSGVHVDFVFYYDFVLRTQLSVNQFGETGFFLDFKAGF